MLNLCFVTATRLSMDEFKAQSLLVQSLARVSQTCHVQLNVAAKNTEPLAIGFNRAIANAKPDDVLVFIHGGFKSEVQHLIR